MFVLNGVSHESNLCARDRKTYAPIRKSQASGRAALATMVQPGLGGL
jgi:hypothetical protein